MNSLWSRNGWWWHPHPISLVLSIPRTKVPRIKVDVPLFNSVVIFLINLTIVHLHDLLFFLIFPSRLDSSDCHRDSFTMSSIRFPPLFLLIRSVVLVVFGSEMSPFLDFRRHRSRTFGCLIHRLFSDLSFSSLLSLIINDSWRMHDPVTKFVQQLSKFKDTEIKSPIRGVYFRTVKSYQNYLASVTIYL